MNAKAFTVGVVPIGDLDPLIGKVIAAHITAYFGLRARVMPARPLPAGMLDPQRLQYDAAQLIHHFEACLDSTCPKWIAVLDTDLSIPIFRYVFGEARQGGGVAVVSLFRLADGRRPGDPPGARILEQAAKIALHELGHLLNLCHCDDPECLMHFSGSREELDRLGFQLCRYCRAAFSHWRSYWTAESD